MMHSNIQGIKANTTFLQDSNNIFSFLSFNQVRFSSTNIGMLLTKRKVIVAGHTPQVGMMMLKQKISLHFALNGELYAIGWLILTITIWTMLNKIKAMMILSYHEFANEWRNITIYIGVANFNHWRLLSLNDILSPM